MTVDTFHYLYRAKSRILAKICSYKLETSKITQKFWISSLRNSFGPKLDRGVETSRPVLEIRQLQITVYK